MSHWYGNVVAVNDVSFSLGPGITGLLGPNGAGKSTLLHMMAGFLAPVRRRGAGGRAGRRGRTREMYRSLGLVPEREAVYPFLTGYEFALMNARLHGLPDPEAAAERAIDIVDLRAAMHRKIGGYSKGMRQRAKIAGALVHEPAHPAAGRAVQRDGPRPADAHDGAAARAGGRRGKTILISTHILEELHHLANNVLVVVAGRLAASGHFREIRRLMTDRPHTFTLRSSDDRRLASALMADPSVKGVELGAAGITVRTAERGGFAQHLPPRRARRRRHAVRAAPHGRIAGKRVLLPGEAMRHSVELTLARLAFRQLTASRRSLWALAAGRHPRPARAADERRALRHRTPADDAGLTTLAVFQGADRLRAAPHRGAGGGDGRSSAPRWTTAPSPTCWASRCRAGASCSPASWWRGWRRPRCWCPRRSSRG